MADLGPGEKLGRFVVEKKLGKGASGVVYLATDTVLGQPVAVKVLHPWLIDVVEVRERFKREIVLTRRIVSSGVCRIHDLHEDGGLSYVTMEFIEGQTLSELIHTEGRLAPERVLQILKGITPPLTAAHAVGVVHRDLKPGNIMVKADGSVCVLDFGMATAGDVTKITQAGRTVGSLRFIAPEVWQGDPATAASDLYALGVVLFACLAGKLPYEAKTPAEAFQAQKQGPPSLMEHNAAVTPGIDAVVRQAMARRPQDRFASVEELCTAFEHAVATEEATSSTGTVIVRPRDAQDPENVRLTPMKEPTGDVFSSTPPTVPRPVLVAAGVVGALVVVAVVAALVAHPRRAAPPEPTSTPPPTPHHLVERTPRQGDDAPLPAPPPPVPPPAPAHTAPAPREPKAAPRPRAEPSHGGALASAKAAVAAAMKKRGVLPGDVPAADALLAKARRAEARGRDAEAAAALEKARAAVLKAPIDRGFITAKQKRLNFLIDRAPASAQGKIAELQSDVERLVVRRDYARANEQLNRALSLAH